ncbi:beta-L-arabinofuranosidase domain-containing protein [Agromyces allii]|uniref:Glycosyl hydrolase n=1 Tax=Agromyces allii TaxID=393607 RepID=A0ABP5BZE1_9MICO|nr:beta-L-arabinofuranosidase domain-containing protein [Agromyces allii]
MTVPRLEAVAAPLVKILDAYEANALTQTADYLLRLEPERFLHGFFVQAGLPPATTVGYGGWERATGPRFQGHFFGHYLSALAQAYAVSTGVLADELLVRLTVAVVGLERCQLAYAQNHPDNTGYLSAFPIEALPDGRDGLIVPFYNLHKILAGLLHTHQHVPGRLGRTALEIASRFGSWIAAWAGRLDEPSDILATEYGGMNDALYELYRITGDPTHRRAAEYFDETSLFDRLAAGIDVLDGLHANTTIPKVIGALKRYLVLSDVSSSTTAEQADLARYRLTAENFWRMVTEHHTYANGGNSQGEHFHEPGSLYRHAMTGKTDGYGENSTSEGCNEYNMLKLTRELFLLTGDVRYLDYYESTVINSILASQHPETGMVTYFQPMAPGYAKVFGRELDEFWCDQGTALESFTKLGDTVYFRSPYGILVARFVSSVFTDPDRNLRLTQTCSVPERDLVRFTIDAIDGEEIAAGTVLLLRVPRWVDGEPSLAVNGSAKDLGTITNDGWVTLPVEAGDRIEYRLPATVEVVGATENPNWVAVRYGPVLLATELSRADVDATYEAGVLVRLSSTRDLDSVIVVDDPEAWKAHPRTNVVRVSDGPNLNGTQTMRFELRDVDARASGWTLQPYYSLHGARYATYFTLKPRETTEHPI